MFFLCYLPVQYFLKLIRSNTYVCNKAQLYRFRGQNTKVLKQRTRQSGRVMSKSLTSRCHWDFMLTNLRLLARTSCLVLVYSNHKTFGINVVSLNRRNSDIFLKKKEVIRITYTGNSC